MTQLFFFVFFLKPSLMWKNKFCTKRVFRIVSPAALPSPVSLLPGAHGRTPQPRASRAHGTHGPTAGLSWPSQRLPKENEWKHCCTVCSLICSRQKLFLTRQSNEGLALHPTRQQPVQHRWTALPLKPGEQCHQLGHWGMCAQVFQTQHLRWHQNEHCTVEVPVHPFKS